MSLRAGRKERSSATPIRLRSAGGVVVRAEGDEQRVAVVQSQYGTWVFPKGLIEEGEEPEEAARRELAEEVGLKKLVVEQTLGWTEHGFERDGNSFRNRVHWFLYKVGPRAKLRLDPQEEVLDCGWFTPKQALSLLSHSSQRRLLRRALSRLP